MKKIIEERKNIKDTSQNFPNSAFDIMKSRYNVCDERVHDKVKYVMQSSRAH